MPRSGRDTHAAPAETRPACRTPPTRSVLTDLPGTSELALALAVFPILNPARTCQLQNYYYLSSFSGAGVPGDLEILQSLTQQ